MIRESRRSKSHSVSRSHSDHVAVAEKYDLYRFTQFNTAVTSLVFNESTNQWHLALAHYPSEDAPIPTSTSELVVDIVID